MVKGFDFGISTEGELLLDPDTYDIKRKTENELRLQLAYDRIKSVANDWYIDNIGSDLELLIGKPCNQEYAEKGKAMIASQLTFDKLWDQEEFYIRSIIHSMTNIEYNIYLKIIDSDTGDTYSYEINATIDLVKGVNVRYGWEPRR
jgi:hypothetical protein